MPNTLFYGDNLDILRRHIPDESVDLVFLAPLTSTVLEIQGSRGFALPPRPPSYQPAQRVRRAQGRQPILEESGGA